VKKGMIKKLKLILSDKIILRSFQSFLILSGLFILVLIWKWPVLPAQLPLFYSLPRSEEVLGSPYALLILPFLSLIIFSVHLIFAMRIFEREKLTSRILIVCAVIVEIILLLSLLKIIFLIS